MGVLVFLAGLIVAVHAISFGMTLHLAYLLRKEPAETIAELRAQGAQNYHIDLLQAFTGGYRIWLVSLGMVAFLAALAAIIFRQPIAVNILAAAIVVDFGLYLTCPRRSELMAQAQDYERWMEAGQHFLVFVAYLVLALRYYLA